MKNIPLATTLLLSSLFCVTVWAMDKEEKKAAILKRFEKQQKYFREHPTGVEENEFKLIPQFLPHGTDKKELPSPPYSKPVILAIEECDTLYNEKNSSINNHTLLSLLPNEITCKIAEYLINNNNIKAIIPKINALPQTTRRCMKEMLKESLIKKITYSNEYLISCEYFHFKYEWFPKNINLGVPFLDNLDKKQKTISDLKKCLSPHKAIFLFCTVKTCKDKEKSIIKTQDDIEEVQKLLGDRKNPFPIKKIIYPTSKQLNEYELIYKFGDLNH